MFNFFWDVHFSKNNIPSLWVFRKKKKNNKDTQNTKPLWKNIVHWHLFKIYWNSDKHRHKNIRLGLLPGQIHSHIQVVTYFFHSDSPLKPSFFKQVLRTRKFKHSITYRTLKWMYFKKLTQKLEYIIDYWKFGLVEDERIVEIMTFALKDI